MWLYECSNRASIFFPQTWNGISHASQTRTHYVIKENKKTPLQYFFKAGNSEIKNTQDYSKFLHTYCIIDNARDLSDRRYVTKTTHLFNGTIIDWCSTNKYGTSRSSTNPETRAMYTGVIYQNLIINFLDK